MSADPAAPTTSGEPTGRNGTVGRVCILIALTGAVLWLYKIGGPHQFFDLKIYMRAMSWWAAGNPLYDYVQDDRVQGQLYFTYPPFAAVLLRPFAGLSLGLTITIFTTLTALALVVTTRWLVTPIAARQRQPRWFTIGLAVLLILAIESTRETITFGQINMLLIVLILADLLFAVPRKSSWAGVGIGLATALKLFPGIFIIYLLATRRWRAAAVASVAAAGATLLAAAVAPQDSWQFWTKELWSTGRVGRTEYTGNQSLLGLLSRLTVPDKPNGLLWLVLVAVIAGYGLWRAARTARAGDEVAGLALTGLVGSLISPITWTHHIYWFIPALLVLVDVGLGRPTVQQIGPRRRNALLALTVGMYACLVYGVVSFHDWGVTARPTDSFGDFLVRNVYVLLALLVVVLLPARAGGPGLLAPAVRPRRFGNRRGRSTDQHR